MPKPKIAGTTSLPVKLIKGQEYCFCTCGLSKKQPFCDGAHKGKAEFKSLRFTPDKTGMAILCMCKHSKNLPYCDGSHSTLKEETI